MEPLLSVDDPDYADFQAGDEDFLLRAAGEMIRRHCGWHIWPSLTVTVPNLRVGSAGIIMLPSLNVTDVAEVVVGASPPVPPLRGSARDLADLVLDVDDVVTVDVDDGVVRGRPLNPNEYVWFREGWVRVPTTSSWYYGAGGYGFIPGGFLPSVIDPLASVTFTHGYEVVPLEVKQVAFELASASAELPSGNVKDIETPGFRLSLTQAPGMTLNEGQCNRLSAFRLGSAR